MENEKNRILYIDFLRIVSALAVVMVHSSVRYVILEPIGSSEWWAGNIYNSFSRFCVPVFFMISGLLLLDSPKSEDLKSFFNKRFKKVLIPFIVWVLIYYFIDLYWFQKEFSFFGFAREITGGPVFGHLWFLYTLIGIYLAAPIIRLFIKYSLLEHQFYFLIIWIFFFSVLLLIGKFWNFRIGIPETIFGGYLGYFILGYTLSKIPEKAGRLNFIFFFAFFFMVFITIIATYYLCSVKNSYDRFFYDYASLNVVIMSASIFLIFRSYKDKLSVVFSQRKETLQMISSTTLGVYLIHPLIVRIFRVSSEHLIGIKFQYMVHPALNIPITFVVVILTSFFVVYTMKKIPIIKHIVP